MLNKLSKSDSAKENLEIKKSWLILAMSARYFILLTSKSRWASNQLPCDLYRFRPTTWHSRLWEPSNRNEKKSQFLNYTFFKSIQPIFTKRHASAMLVFKLYCLIKQTPCACEYNKRTRYKYSAISIVDIGQFSWLARAFWTNAAMVCAAVLLSIDLKEKYS